MVKLLRGKRNYLLYLGAFIVVALFSLLRLWNIETSLLFFNDIGRDYLVLFNWSESGKLPLLGPQTSAIPYNQSAVYFYFLYPMFLLTNQSLYATVFTNLLWYVIGFAALLWYLRNEKKLQVNWVIVFFLLAISPQVIIQHRFVWNPSFVLLPLLAAEFSLLKIVKQRDSRTVMLFGLSAALAVALNYSVIPAVVCMLLVAVVVLKKQSVLLFLATTASFIFWNVPTLLFELRHSFVLTKMLVDPSRTFAQIQPFSERAHDLITHSTVLPGLHGVLLASLLIVILVVVSLWQFLLLLNKNKYDLACLVTAIIAVSTAAITALAPVTLHSHYVFGVLSTFFVAVTFLPNKLRLLLIASLSLIWLRPSQLSAYFERAYRTPAETLSCVQEQCLKMSEPFYVSVQSSIHPFHHDGMEFKYLFKRSGCKAAELTAEQADQMLVVVEKSGFELGKTSYNELSQFGEAVELGRSSCGDLFDFVVLQKAKSVQ